MLPKGHKNSIEGGADDSLIATWNSELFVKSFSLSLTFSNFAS